MEQTPGNGTCKTPMVGRSPDFCGNREGRMKQNKKEEESRGWRWGTDQAVLGSAGAQGLEKLVL